MTGEVVHPREHVPRHMGRPADDGCQGRDHGADSRDEQRQGWRRPATLDRIGVGVNDPNLPGCSPLSKRYSVMPPSVFCASGRGTSSSAKTGFEKASSKTMAACMNRIFLHIGFCLVSQPVRPLNSGLQRIALRRYARPATQSDKHSPEAKPRRQRFSPGQPHKTPDPKKFKRE